MSEPVTLGSPVTAPDLDRMEQAARQLYPPIQRTPLLAHRGAGADESARILLKPEVHQRVGSFKLRGVYQAVSSLTDSERRQGLSTVSAGNTAQALAWCGRYFGVAAYCLMPDTAPPTKIEAVRALGGTPRLVPREEVFQFLREARWRNEPHAFVHPWIDRRVLLGHASLGLEIADDVEFLEKSGRIAVYLPVGGGGLLAGAASALRARGAPVRIVAVEPTGCPALARALEQDRPVTVDCRTACDGIAVPYITEEMFPLLRTLVDDVALVEEDATRSAIRELALQDKLVAEPSGAIALAAAKARRDRSHLAVAVISGGSIDPRLLADVLTAGGG
ncbi:MAG TPA: pyridoxal-phosphate dependent enzyme [Thermoanaerobaculia bacterium]|nr:pyridoxal-phosphate dependent enzyme [Thermoanaerobaculia bacterium]